MGFKNYRRPHKFNPKRSLGGRTPYDVALENYGIDILKALQLRPIPPDEGQSDA